MRECESRVYRCAYCGERNETLVDPSGGFNQEYVEDCTVCCRPNVLSISIDRETSNIIVVAVPES